MQKLLIYRDNVSSLPNSLGVGGWKRFGHSRRAAVTAPVNGLPGVLVFWSQICIFQKRCLFSTATISISISAPAPFLSDYEELQSVYFVQLGEEILQVGHMQNQTEVTVKGGVLPPVLAAC